MFKFNLASFDVREEYLLEIKQGDVVFDPAFIIDDVLRIKVILTKDKDNSVIAEGEIKGDILLKCGRCLEDYKKSIDINFATVYKGKKVYTKEDEESGYNIYKNNEIDMYNYIRDTLILEIPIKLVCRDDCKGLCPVCGKNLNNQICDCVRQSRFRILDDFKLK
jgi:uncharacterized protein